MVITFGLIKHNYPQSHTTSNYCGCYQGPTHAVLLAALGSNAKLGPKVELVLFATGLGGSAEMGLLHPLPGTPLAWAPGW